LYESVGGLREMVERVFVAEVVDPAPKSVAVNFEEFSAVMSSG
jgi:hypothetical protein